MLARPGRPGSTPSAGWPNVSDRPSQRLLSRTAHCVYCQQMFDVQDNAPGSCPGAPDPLPGAPGSCPGAPDPLPGAPGSCPGAPDPLAGAVDLLTCGACARLTLGRCCRLVDPEERAHPCSGELDSTCGRLAALAALSVVAPCLQPISTSPGRVFPSIGSAVSAVRRRAVPLLLLAADSVRSRCGALRLVQRPPS